MSRRTQRVQVSLDTGGIKVLKEPEIEMILRGADELIGVGGRNMLAKILKGSKDKKVLEHHLDECPAYGFYQSLTLADISHKVDWMIKMDYLRIDYQDRLPTLIFSEKGWEIEMQTLAEEIYQKFCRDLKEKKMDTIFRMKDMNRQVVFGVLEKIRAGKNPGFLPMLAAWKAVEVRKVRERISSVEKSIENPSEEPSIRFRKAEKGDAKEITDLIHRTVKKIYPHYYPEEVVDFFCMYHSKERVQADIESGNVWYLSRNGQMVATGSADGNEITRVYVLPEFQKKGYGTRMMEELEQHVGKAHDRAVLDASLSSCRMYEKRGYRTLRHEQINLVNGVILVYEVMEKLLSGRDG